MSENETAVVPAAQTAVQVAAGGAGALVPVTGLAHLAVALSRAQKQVRRVEHDARNEYHKYDYTSAEGVIEAAKDPLADNGLALLPVEETLDGWERQGENRFQLICKFLLIHSSGEMKPLVRCWPVCPEKGRPLDKATAAAATLALSYLLRDLLLMPRVDRADDVAGRNDRPPAERPRQQKQRAAPGPIPDLPDKPDDADLEDAELIDPALAEYLRVLTLRKGFRVEKLLERYGAKELAQLTAKEYRQAVESFEKRPDKVPATTNGAK